MKVEIQEDGIEAIKVISEDDEYIVEKLNNGNISIRRKDYSKFKNLSRES